MVERIKKVAAFVWATIQAYADDGGSQLAAGIAFFTLFSAAPLVIIATALTGLFFGQDVAREEVMGYLENFGGQQTRQYILELIERWQSTSSGVLATLIGLGALLYGAYRVFGALRDALNTVFNVRSRRDIRWTKKIRNELFPFSMILVIGALLFLSLVASTALATVAEFFQQTIQTPVQLWNTVNFVVSFSLTTVMFALMIRVLPDVRIEWRDILTGAVLTSLLFTIGKSLIGMYLGRSGTTSVFGAAGALVAFLFWVYYSAQIFLLGAEFTQLYAERFGGGVEPARGAVPLVRASDEQE